MIYTDIRELKTLLDIESGDVSEDKKLNFLIEQASQWIEELIDRPGFTYKSRTEYYKGTGTQKLLLKSRPVYTTPAIQVYVDEAGYYGSASGSFSPSTTLLTYGVDYALQIDQEDGSSRSGVLIRLADYWPKPQARQAGLLSPFVAEGFGTIKVTYTAGYSVDTLPASFRLAANLLIARLRYVLPLGVELNSENYEDRAISVVVSEKEKLLAMIKPMIIPYRNWKF